jgi:uncharacterized membrane protein YeaQ/YmgE (transglycosylase-associated protein family)
MEGGRCAAPGIFESEGKVFGILGWIVFGLIVGIIAKLLMPGRDPGGFIITILLGIAGSLLGGFVGRALGLYGPNQSAGFLMSVLGALLLLGIYHMLNRRRYVS